MSNFVVNLRYNIPRDVEEDEFLFWCNDNLVEPYSLYKSDFSNIVFVSTPDESNIVLLKVRFG